MTNCIAASDQNNNFKLHHQSNGQPIDMIMNSTQALCSGMPRCIRRTKFEAKKMIFKFSCYLYQFTSEYYIYIYIQNMDK